MSTADIEAMQREVELLRDLARGLMGDAPFEAWQRGLAEAQAQREVAEAV